MIEKPRSRLTDGELTMSEITSGIGATIITGSTSLYFTLVGLGFSYLAYKHFASNDILGGVLSTLISVGNFTISYVSGKMSTDIAKDVHQEMKEYQTFRTNHIKPSEGQLTITQPEDLEGRLSSSPVGYLSNGEEDD